MSIQQNEPKVKVKVADSTKLILRMLRSAEGDTKIRNLKRNTPSRLSYYK